MFIKVRYEVKTTGSICARIDNGKGAEYTTCIHSNGRMSCDCKAGSYGNMCKHKRMLHAAEQARQEQQQQPEAEKQQEAPQPQPVQETVRVQDEKFRTLMSEQFPCKGKSSPSSAEMRLAAMGLMHGQVERRGGWLLSVGSR